MRFLATMVGSHDSPHALFRSFTPTTSVQGAQRPNCHDVIPRNDPSPRNHEARRPLSAHLSGTTRSRKDKDWKFTARKPSSNDRARPELKSPAEKEKGKSMAFKAQGCFVCGEETHWARQCTHRKELLRARKDQPERKTSSHSTSPRAGK